MPRSMSNSASIRLTASSAIGEIAAAFLPRRALAAISASSKNCRLAWAQHSAGVIAPGNARGIVKLVVAAIGVGLQDAGEVLKMPRGMLMPPIARGVIERRRRRVTAKGPVVADIGPDVPRDRLAFGQDRHGRVVAMQPLGRQDMGLDQRMERLQDRRAGADLVGQRRDAQIDAFAPVSLALAVQRLVLAELLEQDHGQQVWSGKAARRHMERRRRLR